MLVFSPLLPRRSKLKYVVSCHFGHYNASGRVADGSQVSQPLHPGGSGYPVYHAHPDYWPEDVESLVAAGGARDREPDPPSA